MAYQFRTPEQMKVHLAEQAVDVAAAQAKIEASRPSMFAGVGSIDGLLRVLAQNIVHPVSVGGKVVGVTTAEKAHLLGQCFFCEASSAFLDKDGICPSCAADLNS